MPTIHSIIKPKFNGTPEVKIQKGVVGGKCWWRRWVRSSTHGDIHSPNLKTVETTNPVISNAGDIRTSRISNTTRMSSAD